MKYKNMIGNQNLEDFFSKNQEKFHMKQRCVLKMGVDEYVDHLRSQGCSEAEILVIVGKVFKK